MSKSKAAESDGAVAAATPLPFQDAPVNARLSADEKVDLLREMVRIRTFEERSLRVYQQGKIGGFLHLYSGQEAVAIGTISLCGDHDHVITAYRDHGHALAVGMSMNECMAELMGKYTGCSKGKGGSMHYFAPDKNFWGGHGIVAGQTPLGAGLAYGVKYLGRKGSCLCYLGDGAVNQGAFHESLNLAGLWDLPVIFVIENNGYSMGTSQRRSSAGEPLAKRAEGYGIEWAIVNGNNLYEVRAAAAIALERAHEQSRPTVLEIQTYRYRGHSVADANHEKYRTKSEIEEYKNNRDPINLFRQQLALEGILPTELFEQIQEAARAEVDASIQFADESPFPPPEEIFTDVYASVDRDPKKLLPGRYFFNPEAPR